MDILLCIRNTNKKKLVSHTYHLNNSPLEWVDTYKYLGVKIQNKLSWGEHIQEVSNKATRVLNVLRRSMFGCHHEAKKRAYMALVRPHLEYCSPVWSPHQHKLTDALEKYRRELQGGCVEHAGTESITVGPELIWTVVKS